MTQEDKNRLLKKLIDKSISAAEYRALELAALDDVFLFDAIEGFVLSEDAHQSQIDKVNAKINDSLVQKKRPTNIILLLTSIAAACLLILYFVNWADADTLQENNIVDNRSQINESVGSIPNDTTQQQVPRLNDKTIEANKNKIRWTNTQLIKDTIALNTGIANVEAESQSAPLADAVVSSNSKANDQKVITNETFKPSSPAVFSSESQAMKKSKVVANKIAVRGKVLNTNGDPVIGAKVITQNQAVTTKIDGTFKLDLNNTKNFAVIAQAGYESQGMSFAKDDYVTIFLKPVESIKSKAIEEDLEAVYFKNFSSKIESKIDKYLREENIKVMGEIMIYFQLNADGSVNDFIFQNSFDYSIEEAIKQWITEEKHLLPASARGEVITLRFEL